MTLSPWLPLFLALPVLLLGEWIVRRVTVLGRFSIPAPIVGGILVSLFVLAANSAANVSVQFGTKVASRWWTWLVTIEPQWLNGPTINVTMPLMCAFFTCVGLNATWEVVRKGSVQVVVFLGVATVLAVIQNVVGLGLARLLQVDPLIGLVCGSVTLTGGHGTALGFSGALEKLGLQHAALLGAAAATLGLVAGGLFGGPIAVRLLRGLGRKPTVAPATSSTEVRSVARRGTWSDLLHARRLGVIFVVHGAVVLACVKIGAWVSHFIQLSGISFSAQIGAMIVGVTLRNVLDLSGRRWLRTEAIDAVASLSLGIFLTVAMMSLNLIDLANVAGPMLAILTVQVVVMWLFATYVTFVVMGRDYDAAVMASGHCGFGLGATPNAVANMKSLVEKYGAAPRAFLVVPLVGAILIDFTNALVITFFMNIAR